MAQQPTYRHISSKVGGICFPVDAVIADGQSLSAAADLKFARAAAVYVPAGAEGSELTFQGSWDGATFADIHDEDGEVSVPFTPGTLLVLPLAKLLWAPFVKVRTGASGSGESVQTGDLTLTIIGA